jgi:hypothetical protein
MVAVAKPPSRVYPVKRGRSQRFSSAAHAVRAHAAGMPEPRDAHAFSHVHSLDASPDRVDPADNFMARNDGHRRVRQLAVDDVQIRAADAARGYLDAHLARSGLSLIQARPFERDLRAS